MQSYLEIAKQALKQHRGQATEGKAAGTENEFNELRAASIRRQNERHYRQKYPNGPPGTQELQEIVRRVESEGIVPCWSHAVEDFVAFYRGEKNRDSIPPGFVPYSLEELSELFPEGEEALSMNALKLVHEAKKMGGRVKSAK